MHSRVDVEQLSEASVFVNCLIHGGNICRGRDRLEIMAWGANPAPARKDPDIIKNLIPHILSGSEGKSLLIVDGAVKNDPVAEIAGQAFSFHSGTAPLDRVEDFNARNVDEIGNDVPRCTVSVIEDMDAVAPGQIGHLLLVWKNELPDLCEAKEECGLPAQIFGDICYIDLTLPKLKQALIYRVMVVKDMIQRRLGDFRFRHEVHHGLFHTSHRAIEEERFEVSRPDNPVARSVTERACKLHIIAIVGTGPFEGMNLFDSCDVCKGVVSEFVIDPTAVVDRRPAEAPDICFRIVRMVLYRLRSFDVGEPVDAELAVELFLCGTAEFAL